MCLDNLEMAEVQDHQYFSIGQEPFVDLGDPTFKDSLINLDLGLREFTIDPVKVREILLKLPTKSGPGPDGIPPHCLKYGGDTVVIAVVDIGRLMFSSGFIPDSLKDT